jgi:hypothetical protein
MARNSREKNYQVSKSAYTNPTTIISLTPPISLSSSNYVGGLRPSYQQSKFSLTSTASSLSSIGIHNTDDDSLKKSSSKDEHSSVSSDKV